MTVREGTAAWSRDEVLALAGQCEIYLLDESAALVPVPAWLLADGAVELTQSIGERMELVHPDDRSIASEMFLTAVGSPGEVVSGEYRMLADGRWFIRAARMVSLVGTGLLDGVLVIGYDTIEDATAGRGPLESKVYGEFTPGSWIVELLDDRATILEIDGMVEEIWGCAPEELIGSSATRFLAPECFASAAVMWANLMANPGATAASRQRVIRPDGSSLWIDSFLVSRPQPDGTIRVMNFINDVTEQREQQLAIERLAAEFRSLAEQVPAAIFRCDRSGSISFHNQRWEGLPAGEAESRLHDLIHHADHERVDAELDRLALASDDDRGTHFEVRGARGDAMLSFRIQAVGQPGSDEVTFVGSIEDITSTVTLRRRATHDPLTGLVNREGLSAYLGAAMTEYPDQLAVGFIDLDGFKSVNDEFDHAVGDQVLASVADRLRRAFRSDDLVARYGGDEFVVVCRVENEAADTAITSGVERALAEPITWAGGSWSAKASIGVARVEPEDDVTALLRRADRNMYVVKAERGLHRATG
jgi:diguanylate cyclase (GGDEF)-like protein/PAS domain S-box-containing protein